MNCCQFCQSGDECLTRGACRCHDGTDKIRSYKDTGKNSKIIAGAKDFAERFEGVMKDLAEEDSPTPSVDNWEEDFDKNMSNDWYNPDIEELNTKAIKSFISTLIQNKREELVKRLEELKVKGNIGLRGSHRNLAIDDSLAIIKETMV